MPDYLTPGVYVEEIELGPPPITGVSTSIPGFVGRTQMGPTSGPPQLVTSYSDFARVFGSFLASSSDPTDTTTFLPHSVNGFFQNGGQILYVQRIAGAATGPASLSLNDAVIVGGAAHFLTQPAQPMPATMDQVTLVAARFLSRGTQITLTEQTAAGVVSDVATVQDVEGDAVTFSAPVTHRYTAAAVVEVPAPAGYTPQAALTLTAANPGTWGQNVVVSVTPSSRTSAVVLPVHAQLQAMAVPLTPAGAMPDDTHAVINEHASVLLLREGDTLTFHDNATPAGAPGEAATIATGGIDTTTNTVTLAAALSHPYDPGAGGALALEDPPALRIASDAAATADVQVTVATTASLATGQTVQIQGAGATLTGDVQAIDPGNLLSLQLSAPFTPTDSVGAEAVLTFPGVPANQLDLSGAANLSPGDIVEFTDTASARTYGTVAGVTGNTVTFDAPVPGALAAGSSVRTVDFDLTVQLTSTSPTTGIVSVAAQEIYRFLNFVPASPNNVVTRINEQSALVSAASPATANPAPQGYPTTIDPNSFTASANLAGGSDGAAPTADDYIGDPAAGPGQRTGIQALQDVDEIAIIAAPGMADPDVHAALIDQCELLKYRFAVIEAPRGSTIPQVETYRNQFDTRYAALYYPWITIHDPLTGSDGVVAPPSGYVAGVYARVDNSRGVHKAPANEVLSAITGLELSLTAGEQGVLNVPRNIDVIRDFRSSGRGIRIWGARCITSETDWKYVNVRRLFIYLEHSLDQGTQWVVFEPNDEPLWARARQSVTAFLTRVWRDGALMGTTADQAFYVHCDRTTMTQDDIDNGRLIMVIGVAPVYPAEFVIIRIGQQTAGATVSE